MTIDALLAPAEQAGLASRDLSRTVSVVFDVLRASTTMLAALSQGAAGILPVAEIEEALAVRRRRPDVLLAGERDGQRIRAEQTGGVDFDLGNSPREYTAERVQGRTIVSTTTNGTRALRTCARSRAVWVGALVNRRALAGALAGLDCESLLLVCAGTGKEVAWEDLLGAGALLDEVVPRRPDIRVSDAARAARVCYQSEKLRLLDSISDSANGRRLLSLPELAADVPWCAAIDTLEILAGMNSDGVVSRISPTFLGRSPTAFSC